MVPSAERRSCTIEPLTPSLGRRIVVLVVLVPCTGPWSSICGPPGGIVSPPFVLVPHPAVHKPCVFLAYGRHGGRAVHFGPRSPLASTLFSTLPKMKVFDQCRMTMRSYHILTILDLASSSRTLLSMPPDSVRRRPAAVPAETMADSPGQLPSASPVDLNRGSGAA